MRAEALLQTLQKFNNLNLSAIINFDKFNNYTIVHHSTSIEGSTLTLIETQLLIEEQITPKGKPILHSLMVQNHFEALQFIIENAKQKTPISLNFIQQVNAKIMRQTGNVYQTVFGEVDASKGMIRKGNVTAGSTYFVNFSKVENLLNNLVIKINESLLKPLTLLDQINLCFDFHFDIVTIHPFDDGNGRTSRLLMNYLQAYFNLPMSIVFLEDKIDYYNALGSTRKEEYLEIFRNFMQAQYHKYLQLEIDKFEAINKPAGSKGYSLVF